LAEGFDIMIGSGPGGCITSVGAERQAFPAKERGK
jgi:hypothetical protein